MPPQRAESSPISETSTITGVRSQVVLKRGKVRPFFGRHPWVLDGAVHRIVGQPANGDEVDLVSDRGQFVAHGLYNSHSRIRVRLYSWKAEEILDRSFWRRRLESALELRAQLGYDQPEGGARLVYSEADGLCGLVVDRYGPYLIVQPTALAMAARIEELVAILVELLQPRGVLLRTDREISKAEGLRLEDRVLWGEAPPGPVFIEEHGIRYGIELTGGQKTGFFLDQRENRRAAAAHVRGRRVLDLFCYSGGFSLAASILGHARSVLGIDSSQRAVALARANAELNGLSNVVFDEGDCFKRLEQLVADGEHFGMVVLDPPKFARNREAVPEALRAYHHLNRLAVQVLEPGGTLVTCSCSGHVSREDFLFMLADVAQRTERDIQILDQRGAAPDHPVAATCLESEYLKCCVARVV
jgi:23S rRNA (cytosine1962-C5)-methyltransferase